MISVIVPIYNVGAYIKECIDSILNQSYSEWELILVDDGSTDQGGAICYDYSLKDKRIQYIHKPNGGVTNARKIGWSHSSGEWVTFVDGDDWLPNNALQTFYEIAANSDTDIIEGTHCDSKKTWDLKNIEEYREHLLTGYGYVSVSVWGKLFRRTILNTWCFDIPREVIRGEDWVMNIRIAFNANKTPILLSNKIYNYRERPTSVTHKFSKNIDLEYKFFQQLRLSIPPQYREIYEKHINRIAIVIYKGCCLENLSATSLVDSSFADEIRKIVKRDRSKLVLHEKILLNSKITWLRIFCWKMYRLRIRLGL